MLSHNLKHLVNLIRQLASRRDDNSTQAVKRCPPFLIQNLQNLEFKKFVNFKFSKTITKLASRTGIKKATVFPEPVLAAPRMSNPCSPSPIAAIWISVGWKYFPSFKPLNVTLERGKSVNFVIVIGSICKKNKRYWQKCTIFAIYDSRKETRRRQNLLTLS